MATMSMTTLSGSAMATPATTLSSSSTVASRASKVVSLRSPASSGASRMLAVRASHASEEHVSKVRVALVATGAAIAMSMGSMGGSAIALDINSLIDNVKDLSSNIQSSDGATELAKQAAQRMATSAARDLTSGDADTKTSKLLDNVKELAGNLSNNQEAKDAAMDIAKNSSSSDGNTVGMVVDAIKSGLDGQNAVQNGMQNAAVDAAKGAARNAAGEFANNAKNRIGAEAGKALFNVFTGSGDDK